MRTLFFFMLGTLMGTFSLSAQQAAPVRKVWDKTLGGARDDKLFTMLPTRDGGYLLGGTSESSKGGDKSEDRRGDYYDYWIIKTDTDGNKLWDKTFGGNGYERLNVMLPTADGGYLLGGSSNSDKGGDKSEYSRGGEDYWIIKTDANGNKRWDKTFGGISFDLLNTMLSTAEGGYLLGGYSGSDKSRDKSEDNRGNHDYWILKIDTDGNKLWDKTFGGNSYDRLNVMLPTADGGYLLGGSSESNKGGDKSEDNRGNLDYWIIKIDAQGNKLWDKAFGGGGTDQLSTMLPTADGGYLLGGYSDSNKGGEKSENSRGNIGYDDYWIIKIDAYGNKLWDKTLGGNFQEALKTILPTADSGYLLGGWSVSDKGGDKSEDRIGHYDSWIIKIDAEGNKLWDKIYGGNYGGIYDDALTTMLPTADGGYLLGGFGESYKSGEEKSEDNRSIGYSDYWIIKIEEDPTVSLKPPLPIKR